MLTAFCRYSDERFDSFTTVEAIADAWSKEGSELWVDLEEPTEAELQAVGGLLRLDADALEDCIHGDQRPRIDEFEDYIFLVLYGVLGVEDKGEFVPRKLAAFCGARLLVTVHREPLQTVRDERARCERRVEHVLGRGVDYVLFGIIDGMVDRYELVVGSYEERLNELEEACTAPGDDVSILERLSDLRRHMIQVRRIAASQIELVAPLAKGEYEYISDALERRFSHVRDHLAHVVERIDGLRELLNGVRDTYHSVQTDQMNAVMKTLTVFAAVLLPLSLVTGIYGMNLRLWPPPDHPFAFWGVLAAMVLIAWGLLYYFRRRRWL
jgi:magnesium transporter